MFPSLFELYNKGMYTNKVNCVSVLETILFQKITMLGKEVDFNKVYVPLDENQRKYALLKVVHLSKIYSNKLVEYLNAHKDIENLEIDYETLELLYDKQLFNIKKFNCKDKGIGNESLSNKLMIFILINPNLKELKTFIQMDPSKKLLKVLETLEYYDFRVSEYKNEDYMNLKHVSLDGYYEYDNNAIKESKSIISIYQSNYKQLHGLPRGLKRLSVSNDDTKRIYGIIKDLKIECLSISLCDGFYIDKDALKYVRKLSIIEYRNREALINYLSKSKTIRVIYLKNIYDFKECCDLLETNCNIEYLKVMIDDEELEYLIKKKLIYVL